jgi:hypothetical protein
MAFVACFYVYILLDLDDPMWAREKFAKLFKQSFVTTLEIVSPSPSVMSLEVIVLLVPPTSPSRKWSLEYIRDRIMATVQKNF